MASSFKINSERDVAAADGPSKPNVPMLIEELSKITSLERWTNKNVRVVGTFKPPSTLESAFEQGGPYTIELDLSVLEVYPALYRIAFDVHHSAKAGLLDLEEDIKEETPNCGIVDGPDLDIFGQQPIKKAQECICYCPTCKHSLAASRFAPHLAKCMGMGRNSSRIASRRIANNSKESVAYSGIMSDDDDDADWTATSDRRRKKRDRNGTRRSKIQKTVRNGDVTVESSVSTTEVNSVSSSNINSTNMNYDGMAYEEKKTLLMQICGVISEHTRKLCTRSMRCPQHSDEQRRAVRATLLGSQVSDVNTAPELIQVDVDTYEEGDGQSMRESLGRWEQEHSNTSSPADSASTSSSSSKKREKLPKSKIKSNKNHKSSPNFPNNNHSQGD